MYWAVIILLIIHLILLIKGLIFPEDHPPKRILYTSVVIKKAEGITGDKLRNGLLSLEDVLEKLIAKDGQKQAKQIIRSKTRKKRKFQKPQVKKKLGKLLGEKGGGRRIPTFVDRHVTLEYKSCLECGQSFFGKKPNDSYDRFLLDLLFEKRGKRLMATHYTIRGHYCDRCNKLKYPKIDAPLKARLGWGLITWLIIKRIARKMAYDAIAAEIIDLCNERISKPTLIR